MKIAMLPIVAAACLGLAWGRPSLAQEPRPGEPGHDRGDGRPLMVTMPPNPIFQALDADGDGELSAKEIDDAPARLRALDKNKDGKISRDEVRPAFGPGGPGMRLEGPRPDPGEVVRQLLASDKDGDGKLTKAEIPEGLRAIFDRADTNGDGLLDKAELTAFARQRGGRGIGRPVGPDGPVRPGGRPEPPPTPPPADPKP